MFVTSADRIRQRAIENIERLALDAIAAISNAKNEPLNKKAVERELEVGLAQAAAELAYAGLIAAKSGVRPDYVELVVDRKGFDNSRHAESRSAAVTRTFVRRLKDAQ